MEWILLALVVVVVVFVLSGIKIVRQQERCIIELFGRYYKTLRSGLNWIFPWIMRVRAVVPTWELPLFLFEQSPKIDFKDGSAVPKGAVVFVKMKNPDTGYGDTDGEKETGAYRAIYEIANWRVAIRDLVENALRSYLNGLTIDEAITMARAGYDLVTADPDSGLPNHQIERIKGVLSGWGFELMRITITDFDLEPELVNARDIVHIRQRAAVAARFVAQQRAEESVGALIEMLAISRGRTAEEIRKEIDKDKELKKEFLAIAKDLITRRMAIDGQSFVDIRVEGTEGLEKTILDLLAVGKRMPKGGGEDES